ncbi:unnamed protein product [Adineta steineri]|uniref:DUF4832 domain-containing protein n=1 Tax=Adineta steineri TaxID=433720 RepID=A0A813PEY2_9BILA|nr:unnamed protein product [Adineta steineri]CAF3680947.1 unnamed protein product [Adineta steineri]
MKIIYSLFLILFIKTSLGDVSSTWTYNFDASSTIGNPLKGFVPYYYGTNSQPAVNFPHSMENQYFPMKSLMLGPNSFDFSAIETVLVNVANRNHHAIVRVYVDYPGRNLSISLPDFLWNGLTIYSGGSDQGLFPDYNNETLINAMVTLIHALGQKYDGDNRIGFWQVGFLGHWGEWHTYPNASNFASTAYQNQILSAFNSSFTKTKFQLRYFHVTGDNNATSWNVGFHDDSFFQDTYGEAWMFYERSISVGADAQWRNQPIGGEVRPELMPCVFANDPVTACQTITTLKPLNWSTCVQLTHSSYQWLSYAFNNPGFSGSDYDRAINGSIMQGYSFFVSEITAKEITCSGTSHVVRVGVTMSNVGVAPFYYLLMLNTKAVDTTTGSSISSKSISVPIVNQLDQKAFVYYFDMMVNTNTTIQFSTWLSSPHLVGNQTIVFAISGASATGVIQLPAISIGSCATLSVSAACTSYIADTKANGTQGTTYTISSDSSVFNNPCAMT